MSRVEGLTAMKVLRSGGQVQGIKMPLMPVQSPTDEAASLVNLSNWLQISSEGYIPVPVGLTPGETPNSGTRLGSTPPAGAGAGGSVHRAARGAADTPKKAQAAMAKTAVNFMMMIRECGVGWSR